MEKQIFRKDCGCRVAKAKNGEGGVNDDCHNYTGGVTKHDGRVLARPFVYPIFWGSAWSKRGPTGAITWQHGALTSIVDFINALSGKWLEGLSQYGVQSIGVFPGEPDTLAAGTDPTKLTGAQIVAEVIRYVTWSQVGVPTTNELQRCFMIFLPNTADMTDFPGACGYHQSTYYNKTTGDHNLFYAVIGMKGVDASKSGDDVINSVSFCISHELAEMFSNPDGRGWYADADPAHGRTDSCEIGDICETKGNVQALGKWTIEKFWSQKDSNCYDPSSLAPAPSDPSSSSGPTSNPITHPLDLTCQEISVRIGHLESQIMDVRREPAGPSRTAMLQIIELELGRLQREYQQKCTITPGKLRQG
jgi:hypothetical protein